MLAIIFGILVTILILYISKDIFKKNKNAKKLLFKISLVLAITTFIVYKLLLKINFLKIAIHDINCSFYNRIVILLLSMSLAIMLDGLFAPIIQKIYENIQINNYEKKYKTNNFQYFRDILQTKSPAILSFCYNKKLNMEDIIVAVILNLQLQNVIKLQQNKIIVIDDSYNLTEHENYMLKNINKSNNKNFNKNFKKHLTNDLLKNKYIKSVNSDEINLIYFMEFFMLWMIFYCLTTIPIIFAYSNIALLSILAYFLIFAGVPLYKSAYTKINPMLRTKQTLELNGKLLGLKNYISDFSNIQHNSIENINLYEEYVIYAIIFNIKGKLNNECKEIYKNIKESLHSDN